MVEPVDFAGLPIDSSGVVVKPPLRKYKTAGIEEPTVFLAGTIDMGNSDDWQSEVASRIQSKVCWIYNPRRDDWDNSWEQNINNPQFNEQVNWELEMIEHADYVIMYFAPDSKSPITLLELGLIAGMFPQKLHVCCPDGFWRKGNVDVVCNRYGIKTYKKLEHLIIAVGHELSRVKEKYKLSK